TSRLVGKRPRVRIAVGLHPELVAQRHHEVALLCGLLVETRYVGEIGIDGSPPHRGSIELQKSVFDRILGACAAAGGRVMSIHSRGAPSAVLDALERQRTSGVPILHWFSGTKTELARADALGCWFSVGPAMLRSRKGRELAAAMPVDRMLTETDAPFGRDGDSPLMPWQAYDCLNELADLKGLTVDILRRQLIANLRRLPKLVE
ncbi:MAG: TatD family deoxyribonuclease, partial [Lysobacteraceae bacterium]